MAIGKQELTRIVDRTLKFLEIRKILSLEELDKNVGKKYELKVKGSGGESIKITSQPSQMNTKAYRISYIMPDSTVPLEIRINPELEYTKIILGLRQQIPGFESYTDSKGRQGQYKFLNKTTDILEVRDALKDVSAVCGI